MTALSFTICCDKLDFYIPFRDSRFASEPKVETLNAIDISITSFGKLPDGREALLYTLTNSHLVLSLTTFGARIASLHTPDRRGVFSDIALGYSDAAEYTRGANAFFGATIGRFGNRIAKGRFELGGRTYNIPQNNGPNALHGGPLGFDQRLWQGEPIENGLAFNLISEEGDQGFPGSLKVRATYEIRENIISLRYEATTDQPTVVNLTNHTYFNLGGDSSPTVLHDELTVYADRIVPIDETLIPTGAFLPVENTPFDFRSSKAIGVRIHAPHPQLLRANGYDHTFVLDGVLGQLRPAAKVFNAESGRVLQVSTTEPGVQVYSGNFLDGSLRGKSGRRYEQHSGLCLETQHFPDSPNQPQFPSTLLNPGDTYTSETVWDFTHD